MDSPLSIRGSDLLTSVFGCWPSFHDAEVVRLELVRAPASAGGPGVLADVHAFEMTKEVGADGHFILRHHVLVGFRFSGVHELRLGGWNHQNVLNGLSIEDIQSGQFDELKFAVRFDGCWGVDAAFLCRDVAIESVHPWHCGDV